MPAYFIARVDVTDKAQFDQYTALIPPIVARFNGKVLVRSDDVVTLEGESEDRLMVVIEFPSVSDAEEFYHCDEYEKAIQVRRGAATAQMLVVPGIEG